MASEALFSKLADALSQPSRAYRAAQAGLEIPGQAMEGYTTGANFMDAIRKRKLQQQTLQEALGGVPLEEGIMNLTGESGAAQNMNIDNMIALDKARKENKARSQFVGTRGNKGIVYDPSGSALSEIPLPGDSTDPILPKSVTPTMSPYIDPSGQPLEYTPGVGLKPVKSKGTGTPTTKEGNATAVNDAALLQNLVPDIKTLFDAYRDKGNIEAKAQATFLGRVLDPAVKQLQNKMELMAFTFGGKNLTENEKAVVFGALFPNGLDNDESRDNKEKTLTDFSMGKIDLLQAANQLGAAGAPLQAMLKAKLAQQEKEAPVNKVDGVKKQFKEYATNEQGVRIGSNDGFKTFEPVK